MKVVLAAHGTRGDVEPCATIGRELRRRGHDVRMAVPPDLVDFVASTGLSAVAYGPDSQEQTAALARFVHNAFTWQNPIDVVRAGKELFVEGWAQMSTTLTALADGADLLVTGQTYHGLVANVAEYHDIPVAAVHHMPICVNGQLALPAIPSSPPVVRATLRAAWWLYWQITKDVDDAQRSELGLPKASAPASKRMARRGSLEIQAYDPVCFPDLVTEWGGLRPFVGALTMQLPTEADGDVAAWIAEGSPPVYFGFGSTAMRSPSDTIAMIDAVCAQLGIRALVYSESHHSHSQHVKLVGAVNYATVFPHCRAVVHHGGAGTTAAALRAGIPMVLLWDVADQPFWAAQVIRMEVGRARRLSSTTRDSLVTDLGKVLAPRFSARARAIAGRMITAGDSVTAAADLLEVACRGIPR